MKRKTIGMLFAGVCAGSVNGLFGAGGGMILVPLLTKLTDLDDREVFPASVSIILPVCLISLTMTLDNYLFVWAEALPYLFGSAVGGIVAGIWGKKTPTVWMHRFLGILILWGGVQYLC